MAETWIVDLNSGKSTDKGEDYDQKAFHVLSNRNQANKPWSYSLSAWNYRYDGFFFKQHLSLKIELKVKQSDDEVRVQDMEIFPLKFATLQLRQQLERRGRTFWSCRQKKFISYKVEKNESLISVCFPEGHHTFPRRL